MHQYNLYELKISVRGLVAIRGLQSLMARTLLPIARWFENSLSLAEYLNILYWRRPRAIHRRTPKQHAGKPAAKSNERIERNMYNSRDMQSNASGWFSCMLSSV